ncbi:MULTISPECIES: type 4a pilus biogenesis protein PilO [Cycloclasticus]|jgi:type IV pilus assembly protein PilO|uniref:Type IV pilus assembly protein PilO n=1 Tax=Cycloclasticus zancles 78-ME TaxID=1198232 RepID=S5T3Q9_9GAMM|nr:MULTISPECIES: type 4a pilus biogenesis protein PilO [Cycloclasticus]AGS38401.1 Type IV pilus assembly protein PilO [Cycloclasticus zancles 78-ME]MBV1897818.1 type 4a pilus biogenesis protein PilO [Cycloclasticus sp.]MDF1830042.1 type 4a pilus biogenesis protein PilO [Cycloclasticus pugetii]PHR50247.1 MAG: pilus assembly protein PilO [Cycloclasticus sp.]SHJ23559.1 type IV pilus assembly protein PilO [Cycloclasticus pugetii]
MNLADINWDFKEAGNWPFGIKVVSIIIMCVILIAAWIYYDTLDQLSDLERAEKQEIVLKKTFERKQAKAVNLEAYKQQLIDMKQQFGAMLQQLPNKTQIADLLVDVSQAGLASGLEFSLFQPSVERRKDFYAEKPIKLTVVGGYHEFGKFVSNLAALPRIVTLHNVALKPTEKSGQMTMNAIAKTYRYLDEGDK